MSTNSPFYVVYFDERFRRITPFLPATQEEISKKVNFSEISTDPLENTSQDSSSFRVTNPLNLASIENIQKLNTSWVEVPSQIVLKVNAAYPEDLLGDDLFLRIKFSNPDRHLEPIANYLDSLGFNVWVKNSILRIHSPYFINYSTLLTIADEIFFWLEREGLNPYRNVIDFYEVYTTTESKEETSRMIRYYVSTPLESTFIDSENHND